MEKYKNTNITREPLPIQLAQKQLSQAEFFNREKEEFNSVVYKEVLSNLFVKWLSTHPHEEKTREFLYATAMALGEVKAQHIALNNKLANSNTLERNDEDDAQ